MKKLAILLTSVSAIGLGGAVASQAGAASAKPVISSVKVTLSSSSSEHRGQSLVAASVDGGGFPAGGKVFTQFRDLTANAGVAFAKGTVTATAQTGLEDVNHGRISFKRVIGTAAQRCGHLMKVEARYGPRYVGYVSRTFRVTC
jgi:hypothetical protein